MNIKVILGVVLALLVVSLAAMLAHGQLQAREVTEMQEATIGPRVAGVSTQNQVSQGNSVGQTKITSGTSETDIRVEVLGEYFRRANSPLIGSEEYFVQACDELGAPRDCVTVAAIARHETDLCKYHTSADTYNCWGFGGPPGYRWVFTSFQESIYTVTDVLVNQYGNQFIQDPRLMERTFCGPQAECDNWGNRIIFFMDEINNLSIEMGYGSLYALR